IFGLGFLMPVVVVAMNFIGVLKAKKMSQIRKYVIFGIFCFGALATPADPYSMLALALPMVALYLIAELIARIHDRREMAAAKRNGELES
ncbi:MAG: twin-arginine translocase subunit TatC, partial [Propionibacteriaceae bacterium]|nr:twin-arginine translocase subunit TatC [Propionibacteriaceae bacterium]